MDKAKKILNFQPSFTLREGLEITWKWYIKNTKEFKKRKNYFLK